MSPPPRQRIAVLVSGTGSNLQALLDATRDEAYPGQVAVVVSNVPGVPALDRAALAGVEASCLDHRLFSSREAFESDLVLLLQRYSIEWVCLAGFTRLLGARFLNAFHGRVVNVHPSLLPAFPGLHAPRQALSAGVRIAGCTVHLVDEGTDTGPILAQAAVAVLPTDDEATLAKRILAEEHRLYPAALRRLMEGLRLESVSRAPPALHSPPLD